MRRDLRPFRGSCRVDSG